MLTPPTRRSEAPREDARRRSSRTVWRHGRPVGYVHGLETTGGVAAPLLAGFSLASIAQVVSADAPPPFADLAVGCLAVAAVLLLFALQFTAIAVSYAATPGQRLEYAPEAAAGVTELGRLREEQWEDAELRILYSQRARRCYNVGLLAVLLGLGTLVLPATWSPWPIGATLALAVVALSVMIEAVWAVSDGRRPRWLLPGPDHPVRPTPEHELADEGYAYVFGRDPVAPEPCGHTGSHTGSVAGPLSEGSSQAEASGPSVG